MNVRYTIETYSASSFAPDGRYIGEICTRPGVMRMTIEIENAPDATVQKIRAYLDAMAAEAGAP